MSYIIIDSKLIEYDKITFIASDVVYKNIIQFDMDLSHYEIAKSFLDKVSVCGTYLQKIHFNITSGQKIYLSSHDDSNSKPFSFETDSTKIYEISITGIYVTKKIDKLTLSIHGKEEKIEKEDIRDLIIGTIL